jgi:hypothetical protein
MSKESEGVKVWRKATKARIVESFGGKCAICGYNSCHDAFDLHHIDPSKKDFALGAIRSSARSWTKIVNELRKCVLLCCRCHRELHANVINLPENYNSFNEEFADYKEAQKISKMTPCKVCNVLKPSYNKTCSYVCSAKLAYKVDWDSIDLLEELKYSTRAKIAERLGVSSTAVAKREKKLLKEIPNINQIILSEEGARIFADLIMNPPRANEKLRSLFHGNDK